MDVSLFSVRSKAKLRLSDTAAELAAAMARLFRLDLAPADFELAHSGGPAILVDEVDAA